MPSLNSLPLSLSEILEARGGPLRELEIWALLCQSAETLQDLTIKGEAGGDEAFRHIITPNSLMVRDNGTITLTEVTSDLRDSLYLAPEIEPNRRQFVSDTAFEKMFVYSLGRTLQVASEFGLTENEVLSISYDLNSLLQAMSERNAAVRLGLVHILEACSLEVSQHPHKPPHTYTLSRLHKTVLSSSARSSFRDSSYGSSGSRQSTLSAFTGRARRPRPHVRHRRENQKSRSRSRSRSRSNSPRRSRVPGDQDSGFVTSSQQSSTLPHTTSVIGIQMTEDYEESKAPEAESTVSTTATSSQFLNTSLSSTESDRSDFRSRYFQAPPYAAAQSVQGLLGMRQGSPAYQKYIQIKERQIRLKQARLGQAPSALNDVRSRLMTPTLMSHDMLDNMSENRSMASLMSYTLGTYKPELHTQYGSAAALNYSKDTEADMGSQLSLMLSSGEYSDALRAEELPVVPESDVAVREQEHHRLQRRQLQHHEYQLQSQQQAPSLKQMQQLPYSRPLDPSTHYVTGPVWKHREYNGPQYVFESNKPAIRMTLPISDNLKNVALLRKLTVIHLTGQKLEVVLDPSSTGQQLFDTVIPHLDFDDFYFFGLTYMSEGEHFFLDADTKLHKVAPEGWKDGPRGQAIHVTFTLYLRVKFYPESLTDFRHASSYHLLYLQLRRDILEERVTCDSDILVRLAGLAMQAEYGDQANTAEKIVLEHYFPCRAVRRLGAAVVENNMTREHKNCAGIPESQAEIEYIKHVRHLPEYGIHFHKLFKTKSNTDTYMWVGLSKHSLVFAEPEMYGRSIVQDHPWNSILKISFNKRRFSIQPKVVMTRGKPPKINFYTSSYRKGRYLLQFSTDQHRFQIRMRTRPSKIETLSGNLGAIQTADAAVGDNDIGEDVVEHLVPSPAYVDPTHLILPDDDEEENDNLWAGKPPISSEHPLQYRNPPPYQPPRMAQILGGLHVFPQVDTAQLHDSLADLAGTDLDQHQLQMLLDMSSNSSSQDSVLTSDKSEFEDNSPRRSPYFTSDDSKLGRRIFEATLEKEGAHGIGLTIVGGETTSSLDLGIFVKSVVAGGPAERDGRIMPGDRLIAIGGISLEGKQHHEAVGMIRDGGPRITLLVSQIRPPGTIKKRNLHDDQSEFEKKLRNSMLQYNPSKIGSTFSKSDVSGLETFLRYDDFVVNAHSSSDSDSVQNSDEKNYPLAPSSPLSSPSRTFSYPGGSNKPTILNYNTKNQHTPSRNTKETKPVCDTEQGLHVVNEDYSTPHFASNPDSLKRNVWHRGAVRGDYGLNESDVDALQHLREEQEIIFECGRDIRDWCNDSVIQNREGFSPGGLTEVDRQHLQMLGDIAALEADDSSSSDSDFDTAIKKTIKGASPRATVDGRVVNSVSPLVIRLPAERDAGMPDLTAIVTYEVIVESKNTSLGIITNKPGDLGFPKDGVYVKDILPGSSAEKGQIIVSGDRILEVAGQSVERSDGNAVQILLDSISGLVTVKVSRSLHKDAMVTGKSGFGNQRHNNIDLHTPQTQSWNLPSNQLYTEGKDQPSNSQNPDGNYGAIVSPERHPQHMKAQPKAMSISKLITSAPKERTKPLDGSILIVPPPPPLALTSQGSESNTQSDMDSDILDSSRSELEHIYSSAHAHLREDPTATRGITPVKISAAHLATNEKKDLEKNTPQRTLVEKINNDANASRDSLSLDGSCEFNEQLLSLKSVLDKVLGSETISSNGTSHISDTSSTDSIVRSARNLIDERQKLLIRQSRLDSDDDAVITLYGNEQAAVYNASNTDDMTSTHDDAVITLYGNEQAAVYNASNTDEMTSTHDDAILMAVRNKPKKSGNQVLKPQYDQPKPEVLQVSLKKDGSAFGFTVAGGMSTGGCFVKQIISDPAETDGRLRPGDKILKVNGQDMTSLSHIEVVSLLREVPDIVNLRLLRYPSPMEAVDKLSSAQPGMLRIELLKPNNTTNLGLSLEQGEIDGQSGIFVKRLRKGSLADKDGRLLEGDRIIQVNGVSIIDISKSAALSVLRGAGARVVLIITRSDRQNYSSEDVSDEEDYQLDDETDSREIYICPRKRAVDVPVIMSPEWLRELELMQVPQGRDDEFISYMLQSLADLIQAGEHTEEFRNLHQMKEVGSWHVGTLPENKSRNRYRNVLPYDENRVKLHNQPTDYINANHICMKVGDTELRYIACQGPIPETTSDFWAMVWQECASVIVMLTQIVENGKVKCHTYWPQTKGSVIDDGTLTTTLVRSYQLEDFVVLTVCLEQKESKLVREVTQLQYTSWPDHGVPDTAVPLLKLLQVVHLLEGGSPVIIHCSAGIGRTGSFIATDTALATIEQGLELDLYEIVRNLRTQRYGMIQTTDQYLFCYTACIEALLALTD